MKNTFSSRPPPSSSNLCPHCAGILIRERVCVGGCFYTFMGTKHPHDDRTADKLDFVGTPDSSQWEKAAFKENLKEPKCFLLRYWEVSC